MSAFVVNLLSNLALNDRDITVYGGSQLRPNIHIKDGCNVIISNNNIECEFVYDSLGGTFYGDDDNFGGLE